MGHQPSRKSAKGTIDNGAAARAECSVFAAGAVVDHAVSLIRGADGRIIGRGGLRVLFGVQIFMFPRRLRAVASLSIPSFQLPPTPCSSSNSPVYLHGVHARTNAMYDEGYLTTLRGWK